MDSLVKRVLARSIQADAISDIPMTMRNWGIVVNKQEQLGDRLPSLMAELQSPDLDQQRQRALNREAYSYLIAPEVYYKASLMAGLSGLFLSILQQYDLQPKDQKAIEKLAQFYSKSGARKFKDFPTAFAKFPALLATSKTQLAITKDILGRSKIRSSDLDGHKVMEAGPFKVINTGGFSLDVMKTCATVVKEAARLLSAKGLSKVCYGEILVSNRVNRKKEILAFYLPSKDEMFIRADLKGHEHDALGTMLHELGHRLQEKFLNSGIKKSEIYRMYRVIQGGHEAAEEDAINKLLEDPATAPKVGDIVVDPKTQTELVFEKLGLRHGKLSAYLHLKDEPVNPSNQISVSIKGWYQFRGVPIDVAKVGGFVSNYAATDPDENFAEMIDRYCQNKLHPTQVAMLEDVLK